MKAGLIIPTFNEWTHTINIRNIENENFVEQEIIRSNIYHTLTILKPQLKKFSTTIVVDDGSTDDTIDQIKRFQREEKMKIQIIQNTKNQGKWASFLKWYYELKNDHDVLVTTDADMLFTWNTIPKLIENLKSPQNNTTMIVSDYIESDQVPYPQDLHTPESNPFDSIDISGTRAVSIDSLKQHLENNTNKIEEILMSGWYTLEPVLNELFKEKIHYIRKRSSNIILPQFLPPFRKEGVREKQEAEQLIATMAMREIDYTPTLK